jgi:hypothetical protein
MGFSIVYDRDSVEDHERAIADLRDYVGQKVFDHLLTFFEDPTMTWDQFAFGCCLAGVEGFPVYALWLKMGRDDPFTEA